MTIGVYLDPVYQDVVDDSLPKQIVHKTDHVAEGQARLISQYADKPRIIALLGVFLKEFQDVEDMLWSILEGFDLATATFAQLDILGRIVKQPRQGLLDADYRTVIRARIKVLRSNGKPEELIEILRLISVDSSELANIFIYSAQSGLGILIELLSTLGPISAATILSLLRQAKPGGVPLTLVAIKLPAVDSLRFTSSITSGVGNGILSSSVTPTLGAKLYSAYGGI